MRPRDRSMLARVAGRIREDRPFGGCINYKVCVRVGHVEMRPRLFRGMRTHAIDEGARCMGCKLPFRRWRMRGAFANKRYENKSCLGAGRKPKGKIHYCRMQ